MVSVKEVKTKKDIKEFIEFPLRLYKGVWNFTPPLYSDEKKLILAGGKPEEGESRFFIAERDGKTVGRIHALIQRNYNELHSVKCARFTRFDSIDDPEVSTALFDAAAGWAKSLGMTELVGPLGFSDLDREGLLIEGFDEDSTFEEQYSFDYYPRLIEDYGFEKDADWLEFELRAPKKKNEMLELIKAKNEIISKSPRILKSF
jgi:hypothetical protein